MSSGRSSRCTTRTRSSRCTWARPNPRIPRRKVLASPARDPCNLSTMAGPTDMSELHLALDRLRPQLCHCGLKGECLGCKGIEMVRAQAEAVVAAASQPILIQVAQESSMKDMTTRFQAMSERLMADPETRQLLEELMRRLGTPPEESG